MKSRDIDKYVVVQVIIFLAILISTPYSRGELQVFKFGIGLILFALGLWISVLGFRQLGTAFSPAVNPVPEGTLVTTGIYSIVRHPMYLGAILLTIGWSLFWGSKLALLFSLVLAAFFVFKAGIEEKLLGEKYPSYADYKARVIYKIIPYLY